MDNKFIGLMVGLTVGVLMVSGFLWPIVSDATATETTFENDGYFYMQKITANDETVHVLKYATDGTNQNISFELDGTEIDTSTWPTSPLNVTIATDGETWVMRGSGTNEYVGLQGVGSTINFGGHNSRTATVTFDSGTVTVERTVYNPDTGQTTAGSTLNSSYTDLWLISPTPTDYVMKKADKTAYLLDDSEYLAMGITTISQWNTAVKITGTVEDFTSTIVYPPNLTTTVTNKAIDSETVSGYKELNALNKLTFTINDGTTTVDATYSYFIVPAEVTAEKAQHLDTTQIALVAAIGTLGAIVLIAAAAGSIRRLD